MFQKTLIVCAVAAMAFTSCTKDEVVVPAPVAPAKSKPELLQANSWRLTAWSGVMEGTTQNQDLFALILDECDHDDQYRFKAQGIMEFDQMADMCSPDEPKVVAATWVYTPATNRLKFAAAGFEVDALVSQLNDSILKLEFEQDLLGVNFDHEWTLKKY
jgi:hypothetical protein